MKESAEQLRMLKEENPVFFAAHGRELLRKIK
jgi:hypothetical protein